MNSTAGFSMYEYCTQPDVKSMPLFDTCTHTSPTACPGVLQITRVSFTYDNGGETIFPNLQRKLDVFKKPAPEPSTDVSPDDGPCFILKAWTFAAE